MQKDKEAEHFIKAELVSCNRSAVKCVCWVPEKSSQGTEEIMCNNNKIITILSVDLNQGSGHGILGTK